MRKRLRKKKYNQSVAEFSKWWGETFKPLPSNYLQIDNKICKVQIGQTRTVQDSTEEGGSEC